MLESKLIVDWDSPLGGSIRRAIDRQVRDAAKGHNVMMLCMGLSAPVHMPWLGLSMAGPVLTVPRYHRVHLHGTRAQRKAARAKHRRKFELDYQYLRIPIYSDRVDSLKIKGTGLADAFSRPPAQPMNKPTT